MNENDLTRLNHMISYAREAIMFAEDQTRESLEDDLLAVRALTYSIAVIGEAANSISREFQEANPQVPWTQMIGMRNRLFHGYFGVSLDRLWDTVRVAIPALLVELEKLLPPEKDVE